MNLFQAIIIAIVEGITEYLPISSTGHMIITSSIMGIEDDDFTKLYEVVIQLGAILAAVVLYRDRFFKFSNTKFYLKLIIAVLPALFFGALFSDKIDEMLESPVTVGVSLIVGGVFLLFVDRLFSASEFDTEPEITNKTALLIGLWQCLAMIPGVSRSGATIVGGMQQKLSRRLAAEFSFFLAVPTMCAATGHKLLKGYKLINEENLRFLVVGNVVAFIVAIIAIKFFITFLQKHGFQLFGWYRIIVGTVLLVLLYTGWLN